MVERAVEGGDFRESSVPSSKPEDLEQLHVESPG